jgi:hypothetical protein
MSSPAFPVFKIFITPRLALRNIVESLDIVLTIESPPLEADSILVSFHPQSNQACIKDDVFVCDGQGEVPIVHQNKDKGLGFNIVVGRRTSGDIKLHYGAVPAKPRFQHPAFDLRSDQGGILGSGLSFLPAPSTGTVYLNIVEWNLSEAPAETRAVWTFGEGPAPVEKTGPVSILLDSVYMIGPIHSSSSTVDYYGYYWFGTLPSNIEVIKDEHHVFFMKASEFFEDPPSASNPYRSFVRRNGSSRSFGGNGFIRSQIFDYDDQIAQAEDYDLIRRVAYEMLQNWLGPSTTDDGIDWLYEGIKNCLSIFFPFRFKFRTGHYFQSTISMLCMKYYTNPLLHLSQEELLKLAPTNQYATEMITTRAWAFVIRTDLRARKISKLLRPNEDLAIKPLAKLRAMGKPHGIDQWIELLQPLMGDEAMQRCQEMLSGSTILLPVEVFGAKTHYLKQVDQEILDFGMERASFDEAMVRGLEKGSRAEEAGLRDGDKIIWSSYIWRCEHFFERSFSLQKQKADYTTKVSITLRSSWKWLWKEKEEKLLSNIGHEALRKQKVGRWSRLKSLECVRNTFIGKAIFKV